jgi:hypothetical protein
MILTYSSSAMIAVYRWSLVSRIRRKARLKSVIVVIEAEFEDRGTQIMVLARQSASGKSRASGLHASIPWQTSLLHLTGEVLNQVQTL